MHNIVAFAIKKNCEVISLKRFRPIGNGNINYDKFVLDINEDTILQKEIIDIKKEYGKKIDISLIYSDFPEAKIDEGCPCGRTSLGLMPNGDLKMCVYGKTIIGNLLDDRDSLENIWQNNPFLIQNRKHHICEGLIREDIK